ncbi:hypothetical protein HJC23_003147 [Cyclotella cryptica]|uniref:Uncharacterized protein n=1 Tax=Cyclotella cryptica TaxID=29204 RepID=A0ABD3NLB2_9STRA
MPVLSTDGFFGNLEYSDEATAFSRMTKSMLSRMSKAGKLDVANVEMDGSASNASSSPKVDDTPLLTLKNLRAFWESRVLGKEVEENDKTKNDPKPTLNQSEEQELDASNSFGANSQHSNTSSHSVFLSTRGSFVSFGDWSLCFALGATFLYWVVPSASRRSSNRSTVSLQGVLFP